jgi:predicted chitinase
MDLLKLKSKFGLNSFELANFLGQCAHESANFRATSENLNYFLIKFNKRKYIRVLYTEKTTLN